MERSEFQQPDRTRMNCGYIWLYRKFLENPIFTQLAPAVAKVAIFFLLRANYKPIQWYDGVSTIEIPAGSFITSLASTAAACNISRQQVRDAFGHLSRLKFATHQGTHRWTIVTVLNWAAYQCPQDNQEHTGEPVENQSRTPNKKERSKEYTPPTPQGGGQTPSIGF